MLTLGMSCCSLLIFSSEFDLWLFLYSFLTLHLHQAFMAVDGIGTVVSVLSGRVRIILASVFFSSFEVREDLL